MPQSTFMFALRLSEKELWVRYPIIVLSLLRRKLTQLSECFSLTRKQNQILSCGDVCV